MIFNIDQCAELVVESQSGLCGFVDHLFPNQGFQRCTDLSNLLVLFRKPSLRYGNHTFIDTHKVTLTNLTLSCVHFSMFGVENRAIQPLKTGGQHLSTIFITAAW